MVVDGVPPKVRRKKAMIDKRGKWVGLPLPSQRRAVAPMVIPEAQLATFSKAKASESDIHRRWRLLLSAVRAPRKERTAALLIATQVALRKKKIRDLQEAHKQTVSELEAHIALQRSDIEDFLFWQEQDAAKLAEERERVASLTAQLQRK